MVSEQLHKPERRIRAKLKSSRNVAARLRQALFETLCGREQVDRMLFPDAAIEILREARWSPDATRSYEIMSGGFHWSDERLGDVPGICLESDNWSFRHVMGYRASLIRGVPRNELREPWDQLRSECPDWPGFRSERCVSPLAAELNRQSQQACNDLDELDRKINAAADPRTKVD